MVLKTPELPPVDSEGKSGLYAWETGLAARKEELKVC
jgi:hypothetical protein